MTENVRVRFAPSPTGPLHIGGVRTALFNYLFAKQNNGKFILRIEDTDQNRFVPGAEAYILETFEWLNIPFDESPELGGPYGPYRQSERKGIYRAYADQLLENGHAYYAFDTTEELDAARQSFEKEGKTFIYNWETREDLKNSLTLSAAEVQALLDDQVPYVIRFKIPKDEILQLSDLIRGDIKVDSNILDDKVLFKSDGMPTYHLANIVDDHLMEISHVIRGEEWLPSLPLHELLYRAFEWKAPEFAHLPLILKPTGNGKLSKRDGDKMGFPVFPLLWRAPNDEISQGYRENGYLPEAVINMLALLGWNPGTEQEIFSIEELISEFDLKRVNKAGAKFDPEKTNWFQHQYFQKQNDDQLIEEFQQYLNKKKITTQRDVPAIVTLLKERVGFLKELWEQGSFFFETPQIYDSKAVAKSFHDQAAAYLEKVDVLIDSQEDFTSENLSAVVKQYAKNEGLGMGKLMMPLRLALVGEMKGPDVFEIMELLGKEETHFRLNNAISFINSPVL